MVIVTSPNTRKIAHFSFSLLASVPEAIGATIDLGQAERRGGLALKCR
jgi:hypothetical protein